jgi:23S rRNA (cytosine1962-C5)-methyltransferase
MVEVFEPISIVERNDLPIRAAENLEQVTGVLYGDAPESFELEIEGITYQIRLLEGQKTGLYLDQFDNYASVAKLAKDRRVLDCFCNQGGFALHAARAGAASVEGIDSSAVALAAASENARRNELDITWTEANVFDFLKQAENDKRQFDLIVLDPPSFTRNRKSVRDAMRGYKEIHHRAMRLLTPGGILSTYCCSHHVKREEFYQVIADGAVDARRTLRLLSSHSQRRDHPVILTLPETEYLKGFTFESVPAW